MDQSVNCTLPHILITGTSSGIGKATKAAAVAAGFHVFAGERSTQPAAAATDVSAPHVTPIRLDIANPEQITAAVAQIDDHVGAAGLDALANIAGVGVAAPLELVPIERLRFIYEVNVIGQMALTQPVIPLIRRAQGRIVFVGSVGDRITVPFAGPLTSSKAAVAFLSDTLRQELAPWAIDVILVEPGSIHTPAVEAMQDEVAATLASWTSEQSDLYAKSYQAVLNSFLKDELAGSPPDVVAETIITACITKHPKAHYLTGAGAHKLAAMAHLPQATQDAAKRKIFGLPAPGAAAVD